MDFLFQKTNSRYLAFIRIVIGTWFFVDMATMLFSGYVKKEYVLPEFHFPFYGFEWIKPLPGIGMYVLFSVLMLASIGIILGYRLRLSLAVFLIGFTYVFMCDIVYTLNKFYLFLWLAFILIFTNADRALALVKPDKKSPWVPYWQVFIFQFILGMIYFYSGLSKLNPDWLFHGEPLMIFLRKRGPFLWMSDEVFRYAAFVFTYCGMLFDLSITFLLLWNWRSRVFGHCLQITFHSLNFTLLGIGSLSIFASILTLLLFPTDWIKKKLGLQVIKTNEFYHLRTSVKKLTVFALAALMLVHLAIPHRHYFTGNNVNWTEKGHRFSWRLMTRTKRGSKSTFYLTSDQTDQPIRIQPYQLLTRRQYRKMSGETDLVIAFAHMLKDKYEAEGHTNIKITASVMTKLNGRNPGYLVDPDLDLTKVSRSLIRDRVSNPIAPRN